MLSKVHNPRRNLYGPFCIYIIHLYYMIVKCFLQINNKPSGKCHYGIYLYKFICIKYIIIFIKTIDKYSLLR